MSRVISSEMGHFTFKKSRKYNQLEPDLDLIKIEKALAAHCAAKTVVKPRKFLAIFAIGNRWQIMLQRFAQQFEIFARKNGAGSGWFGHCDNPFLDAAIKPLG